MYQSKKHGNCHVCGKLGKLTYEHVPPKCAEKLAYEHVPPKYARNKRSVKKYMLADVGTTEGRVPSNSFERKKYISQQRGSGDYSLCDGCNSYFGANYVKEYCEAVSGVLRVLSAGYKDKTATFHFENFDALAFIKQVILMYCATRQSGSMLAFKDFLIDRESNAFPSGFRLFMYVISDINSHRSNPRQKTKDISVSPPVEIAINHLRLYPFGFILYEVEHPKANIPKFGLEITDFAKSEWGAKRDVPLDLAICDFSDRVVPIFDEVGMKDLPVN